MPMQSDKAASSQGTCWSLVQGAAAGIADDREAFARIYLPVVRAYLGARWRGGFYSEHFDDAVQDTFVDCFREGGALIRAQPSHPGRFRTFLYAVVRNIALRYEQKRGREEGRRAPGSFQGEALEAQDDRLSRVFDRAWASGLLKRAVQRQHRAAQDLGPRALRRVELLQLRFGSDLPIREIAKKWNEDPTHVHREYALARKEFKEALKEEVSFHNPGTPAEIERECVTLLSLFT